MIRFNCCIESHHEDSHPFTAIIHDNVCNPCALLLPTLFFQHSSSCLLSIAHKPLDSRSLRALRLAAVRLALRANFGGSRLLLVVFVLRLVVVFVIVIIIISLLVVLARLVVADILFAQQSLQRGSACLVVVLILTVVVFIVVVAAARCDS